jgi:hypothetical protein
VIQTILCKPHLSCAEIQRTSWLREGLPSGIDCANALCIQLSKARLAGQTAQSVAQEVKRALSPPLLMPPPKLARAAYDGEASAAAMLLSGQWLLQIQHAAMQAGLPGIQLPTPHASVGGDAVRPSAHKSVAPHPEPGSQRHSICVLHAQGTMHDARSSSPRSGDAALSSKGVRCSLQEVYDCGKTRSTAAEHLKAAVGALSQLHGSSLPAQGPCSGAFGPHRLIPVSTPSKHVASTSCGNPVKRQAHGCMASPGHPCSSDATDGCEAQLQCGRKRKRDATGASSQGSSFADFKAQRNKCSAF